MSYCDLIRLDAALIGLFSPAVGEDLKRQAAQCDKTEATRERVDKMVFASLNNLDVQTRFKLTKKRLEEEIAAGRPHVDPITYAEKWTATQRAAFDAELKAWLDAHPPPVLTPSEWEAMSPQMREAWEDRVRKWAARSTVPIVVLTAPWSLADYLALGLAALAAAAAAALTLQKRRRRGDR